MKSNEGTGKKVRVKKGEKTSSKKGHDGDSGSSKEMKSLIKALVDRDQEVIQVEDVLVESMNRFRDLFEQSPIGVGIYDVKGELLIVNKAYLEIFGLDSFGDIKQQNLFSDFKLTPGQKKKIRSGQIVQHEARYNFDEHAFASNRENAAHIFFSILPFYRENDLVGYKMQIQDITERKKIAETQRLAQLGRLLSDMAHEVNNPLMIISGRTELALMDEMKDKKIKEALDVILKQCYLAKDIIQRVLKYSRIAKVEKSPVDIQKTIDLIVDILQHHFCMSKITFKKEIKMDIPAVMGSEKQLQEVFMNILRNSADAMPDGGDITIKASREKNFLRFDIEDTGRGMPKKVLDRIFEPFFTTRQEGTGLGLAVCRTIMQEHGGQLHYKSKVGKGTTASVLLPFKRAVKRK